MRTGSQIVIELLRRTGDLTRLLRVTDVRDGLADCIRLLHWEFCWALARLQA